MSPSTAIYHQQQQQDLQQQQHSSSSTASRPSPLKIKKDSHFIQKSSSSSSSSSVASSTALSAIPKHHHHQQQQQQQQQQRHPVIIYTHSPRVIHTKARDFMALVQKLTGLENDQSASVQPNTSGGTKAGSDGNLNSNNKKKLVGRTNHEDNDSSSGLTGDENSMKDVDQGIGGTANSIPAHPNHTYNMIDLPIFTPNSTTTDSFYYPSSRPSFYTFPNPVISFANYMGNYNTSPSFHQVIKGGGAQEDY